MRIRKTSFILLSVLLITATANSAYRYPVWSTQGMAATPHSEATKAAVQILRDGGNAVDAAVAAAFALSVVEPYHSGLGGGEFAVVWVAKSSSGYALDARESAPAASTPDMYIDPATEEPFPEKSWRGGLAGGVPGSVAGRVALSDKFGKLPFMKIVGPSEKLARDGFLIDRSLASKIEKYRDELAETDAGGVFLENNTPLKKGQVLIQPALARTLSQIAEDKGNSFHHGSMADAISRACLGSEGILTEQDMAEYKVVWREPVRFSYRGYEILSMPPPSSGGVCLAEILNILEGFPLDFLEQGSAESYHLLASAFEYAFADRAKWLGDPDFSPQPVSGMTSKEYAEKLREKIDRNFRTPLEEAGDPWKYVSGGNTSHISVIDKNGNMCSITTSVNTSFGSLVYVSELGFFLNSTMDDFSIDPGEPNKWDLVGTQVNSIAPGKRPLSSMSPTLILKDGNPYMSLGSVGGPRIITSVAQMIVNIIDYKMNVQAAMDAPRIHMQWKPDMLYTEEEIPTDVIKQLRSMGWTVKKNKRWSISQAVMYEFDTGDFYGAADSRGVGTAGPSDFDILNSR